MTVENPVCPMEVTRNLPKIYEKRQIALQFSRKKFPKSGTFIQKNCVNFHVS